MTTYFRDHIVADILEREKNPEKRRIADINACEIRLK